MPFSALFAVAHGEDGGPDEALEHLVRNQEAAVAEVERVLGAVFAPLSDEQNALARAVVSELDDRILDPASATLELHGFGQRVEAFRGKGLERLRPGRRAEGRRRLTPVPAIPSVVRRPDDELATTVFGLPDVDENAGWELGFVPGHGLGGSIQARIGEVEHRAPF